MLKPNKTTVRPSLTASSPCYPYYLAFGAIYLIKSATIPWSQLLSVPEGLDLGWGDVTSHSQTLCHLSGNIRDPMVSLCSGPLLQVASWRSLFLGRKTKGWDAA